jgi:hypothetical protein
MMTILLSALGCASAVCMGVERKGQRNLVHLGLIPPFPKAIKYTSLTYSIHAYLVVRSYLTSCFVIGWARRRPE